MYIQGDTLTILKDSGDFILACCEGEVGWVKRENVSFDATGPIASSSSPSAEEKYPGTPRDAHQTFVPADATSGPFSGEEHGSKRLSRKAVPPALVLNKSFNTSSLSNFDFASPSLPSPIASDEATVSSATRDVFPEASIYSPQQHTGRIKPIAEESQESLRDIRRVTSYGSDCSDRSSGSGRIGGIVLGNMSRRHSGASPSGLPMLTVPVTSEDDRETIVSPTPEAAANLSLSALGVFPSPTLPPTQTQQAFNRLAPVLTVPKRQSLAVETSRTSVMSSESNETEVMRMEDVREDEERISFDGTARFASSPPVTSRPFQPIKALNLSAFSLGEYRDAAHDTTEQMSPSSLHTFGGDGLMSSELLLSRDPPGTLSPDRTGATFGLSADRTGTSFLDLDTSGPNFRLFEDGVEIPPLPPYVSQPHPSETIIEEEQLELDTPRAKSTPTFADTETMTGSPESKRTVQGRGSVYGSEETVLDTPQSLPLAGFSHAPAVGEVLSNGAHVNGSDLNEQNTLAPFPTEESFKPNGLLTPAMSSVSLSPSLITPGSPNPNEDRWSIDSRYMAKAAMRNNFYALGHSPMLTVVERQKLEARLSQLSMMSGNNRNNTDSWVLVEPPTRGVAQNDPNSATLPTDEPPAGYEFAPIQTPTLRSSSESPNRSLTAVSPPTVARKTPPPPPIQTGSSPDSIGRPRSRPRPLAIVGTPVGSGQAQYVETSGLNSNRPFRPLPSLNSSPSAHLTKNDHPSGASPSLPESVPFRPLPEVPKAPAIRTQSPENVSPSTQLRQLPPTPTTHRDQQAALGLGKPARNSSSGSRPLPVPGDVQRSMTAPQETIIRSDSPSVISDDSGGRAASQPGERMFKVSRVPVPRVSMDQEAAVTPRASQFPQSQAAQYAESTRRAMTPVKQSLISVSAPVSNRPSPARHLASHPVVNGWNSSSETEQLSDQPISSTPPTVTRSRSKSISAGIAKAFGKDRRKASLDISSPLPNVFRISPPRASTSSRNTDGLLRVGGNSSSRSDSGSIGDSSAGGSVTSIHHFGSDISSPTARTSIQKSRFQPPVSHRDFEDPTVKTDGMEFQMIQPPRRQLDPPAIKLKVDSSSLGLLPPEEMAGLEPPGSTSSSSHGHSSLESEEAAPEIDEWGFLVSRSPTPALFHTRTSPETVRAAEQKWLNIIATPLSHGQQPPKKVRRLVIEQGVPNSLRGRVWGWFMSNGMNGRVGGLFQRLVSNEAGPFDDQIERDVAKVYSDHSAFCSRDSPGRADLRTLLRAYVHFAPSGYHSELALIGGALLIHAVVEDAFWLLAGLFNGVLKTYYVKDRSGFRVDLHVFAGILQGSEPKVAQLFRDVGVAPHDYLQPWWMGMLIRCLPWPTVLRLFDAVISEGPRFLLIASLAVITLSRDRLLALPRNSKVILNYLHHLPQDSLMLPDTFMRACDQVKLRDDDLKKLRASVKDQLAAAGRE